MDFYKFQALLYLASALIESFSSLEFPPGGGELDGGRHGGTGAQCSAIPGSRVPTVEQQGLNNTF